jgi:hypothetical protein
MKIYGEKATIAEASLPRSPRMTDQETIKGESTPEKEDVIDTTNP